MKVLIIQGGPSSNLVTGEEVVINNDIKYLQSNSVTVAYEKIEVPSSGWHSLSKTIGGLTWSFSNHKQVKSIIRQHKPDVVHLHTVVPYLSFSAISAARQMNLPIVQTLHNGRWLCLEGGYFRNDTFCNDCIGGSGWLGVKRGCGHGRIISLLLFLNNFIVRRSGVLFKYVSRFIAVSDFVKEQHIKSGFPENQVTVRNNGFSATPGLNTSELSPHREGVVYAGRLSTAKGAKVLRYLIQNLACKISIVGNGPELISLQEFCSDHQFSHVEFYGRLDNQATIDIIKRAAVTVVPSQCGDSYPTTALESLSVGTPIVASNLGGLVDIVNASLGGDLVDYDNNQAFLASIKDLLDNHEKAKKMGVNGMKYVAEHIEANRQSKALIRIYNQVMEDYKIG